MGLTPILQMRTLRLSGLETCPRLLHFGGVELEPRRMFLFPKPELLTIMPGLQRPSCAHLCFSNCFMSPSKSWHCFCYLPSHIAADVPRWVSLHLSFWPLLPSGSLGLPVFFSSLPLITVFVDLHHLTQPLRDGPLLLWHNEGYNMWDISKIKVTVCNAGIAFL